jgi:hypothetical protein
MIEMNEKVMNSAKAEDSKTFDLTQVQAPDQDSAEGSHPAEIVSQQA